MEDSKLIKKFGYSLFETDYLLQKHFFRYALLVFDNIISEGEKLVNTTEKKTILNNHRKTFQNNISFLEKLDPKSLILIINETKTKGPGKTLALIESVRKECSKIQSNDLHSS